MASDILVYTSRINPRVSYILETLLGEHLGLSTHLTTDADAYYRWSGPRLAYAPPLEDGHPMGQGAKEEGELLLPACDFLFEEEIEAPYLRTTDWRNLPTLFPMDGDCMAVPFDLPAAAFYLLSCFEEYLPFEADAHGRFTGEAGTLAENGFLERPLVDLWRHELAQILQERYPDLVLHPPAYRFVPTVDIDQAYAYQGRPGWKIAAGFVRDILRLDTATLGERMAVHLGAREDPFNTYRRLQRLFEAHGADPVFFIQVGNHSRHDHALPPGHPLQQKVMGYLQEQAYTLGLHPSYTCMERPGQLAREKQTLEEILGQSVTESRMHFLRFRLPETLRELIEAGIERDYSLGFPDTPGWRAGTSLPHRWFDVEANQATALERVPFFTMDRTMRHYRKMSPEDALTPVYQAIHEARRMGGVFSFIWHNSSANTQSFEWRDWQVVLEEMIREGSRDALSFSEETL